VYLYEEIKEIVFFPEHQITFLKVRDKIEVLLSQSGAVNMEKIISGISGDTWLLLACVDRIVELNEIKEVIQNHNVTQQKRIFTR